MPCCPVDFDCEGGFGRFGISVYLYFLLWSASHAASVKSSKQRGNKLRAGLCSLPWPSYPVKMWSMKVIIMLLSFYGCPSAGKRPHFVSRNFNNVLHWDRVEPDIPGEEVLYSVRYLSDAKDQRYQTKVECENITAQSCDLTAETPSVFDVHYYAKVFAKGRSQGSTLRFKPIAQTVLGQPILSKWTTVSSLYVNVTLPLGPNGISIGDIFYSTKRPPFNPSTLYILNITHPKWAAQVNTSTTGQFVIHLKNNNTEYCGYVVYKPNFEVGRSASENASFCVTLPGDPWMLFPWFLVLAALLLVIVTISVVYICCYVKGGKENRMPESLVTSFNIRPQVPQPPDKNLFISKPEVCPQSGQTLYSTIQVKLKVPSVGPGGYSPQDLPCQALPGNSGSSMGMGLHSPTPGHEDTSSQFSEIYSAVGVHVPGEETEGLQQATKHEHREGINLPWSSLLRKASWDTGGTSPKLISRGVSPLPDLDSQKSNPVGPLLLNTVWDINGQLMFPTLTFQSQSTTAGTVLPCNREGTPLLSDLVVSGEGAPSWSLSLHSIGGSEWSDSGCDESTVNSPTQLSCNSQDSPIQPLLPAFPTDCQSSQRSHIICESGYKQNWMPASPLETTPEDNYEQGKMNLLWSWTDPKEEEEEEEKEGEENVRQIYLGGWVVQIQE